MSFSLVANIPSFPNTKYDEWYPLTRFKDGDVPALWGERILLLQTNLIVRKWETSGEISDSK